MKKVLILTLALLLAAALAGCAGGDSGGTGSQTGGSSSEGNSGGNAGVSANVSANVSTGVSNHVFIENEPDEIIMFHFEDAEHRQMVEEWLRTVLFAEDYYEFIDGEDYDAPYDFDRAESLLSKERE